MKLTKVLFVFFALCSCSLHAQQAFNAGLAMGMTTTQISGDGLGGWHKFGLSGGAYVNAPLSSKRSLRIGIYYTEKGSRTKQDTINYISFAYRLKYVEVPVQLAFQDGPITFTSGLYYGRLIKQEILANKLPYPVTPPFRSYEVGLCVGALLQLGDHLFIEGKFSTSVIPTRPSPNFANKNSFYEKGNYNQVLNFMIGRNF